MSTCQRIPVGMAVLSRHTSQDVAATWRCRKLTNSMNLKSLPVLLLAAATSCAFSAPEEQTSIDVYCEAMTSAYIAHLLDYKAPRTPSHKERVAAVEREVLDHCKSSPAVGESKKRKALTPEEVAVVTCTAEAEGVSAATDKRPPVRERSSASPRSGASTFRLSSLPHESQRSQ